MRFLLLLLPLFFLCGPVLAVDQATFDQYIQWSKDQNATAEGSATTTDPATVPGYQGTNLPEAQYYDSQDTGQLTQDGINAIPNSEAGTLANDQAQQPKLQFSDQDPLISNAQAIEDGTTIDGAGFTTTTTNCTDPNATTPVVYEERSCVSWKGTETQNCDKNLLVEVAQVLNCPEGSNIYQQYRVFTTRKADDLVWLRIKCLLATADNPDTVHMRVAMNEGSNRPVPPDTAFRNLFLPIVDPLQHNVEYLTYVPEYDIDGTLIGGNWVSNGMYPMNYLGYWAVTFTGSTRNYVVGFWSGGCDPVTNDCNYTLRFFDMRWAQSYPYAFCIFSTCSGGISLRVGTTYFNALRSTIQTFNVSFKRPVLELQEIGRSWDNQCASLEAQVQ